VVAALLAALTLLAPAAPAGAGAARPLVSLSAAPSRVELTGAATQRVEVTNVGTSTIVVSASAEGLSLDARGRPAIVRRSAPRSAAPWLRIAPPSFSLRPGAAASVTVASTLPRRVEPGDHHAVLLLASRPLARGGVNVRMRVGVRVVVRAPGRVVRRLVVTELRVRRARRVRLLEVTILNRGNVTETLPRGRLSILLVRNGKVLTRLVPDRRELLPRSRGVLSPTYRGRLRGPIVVRVEIDGRPRRSFRLRL
jgi:hypothetical protein